jgi:AcrR family transcriptional regulator
VSSDAGKRERTKAANRAAILQAALAVFAELGYGAASVRDIIRRTELAAGTFYNYFPDKEAVLRALLDEQATEVRSRLRRARQSSATLEEFVASGFRAYYDYLVEDPLLFQVTRRNAGTIRALFDEPALGAGTSELAEDLRAGIAAGALPELDAELMARAMIGAGFEIGVLLLEREPTDVEGAVAFVTQLFLGGIERLRDAAPQLSSG